MLLLYLKLIACATIGLGFQLYTKNNSLTKSSDRNFIEYNGIWELIKTDWRSILGTVATVSLLFLIFGQAIDPNRIDVPDEPIKFFYGYFVLSKRIIYEGILSLLFATVGYVGQSLALKVFG